MSSTETNKNPKDPRAEWLEKVRAKEKESHSHQWGIESGSTDGYFHVYCWCGAWAWQDFSGEVRDIQEPSAEIRTRQFEKRLWSESGR